MISRSNIKRLENKYNQLNNRGRGQVIIHHISLDGRLLDEDGFLLDEERIKLIKENDESTENSGNLIVYITNYSEPMIRILN